LCWLKRARIGMSRLAAGVVAMACIGAAPVFIATNFDARSGKSTQQRPLDFQGRQLTATASLHRGASTDAPSLPSASWAVMALAAGAAVLRASRRSSTARRANLVATSPDQAIPWYNRIAKMKIEPGMGMWAEKLNMTSFYVEEDGIWKQVPATILVVKRGGNLVTDKKWPEKHGIYSVRVGYDRHIPDEDEQGGGPKVWAELAKKGLPPLKVQKEFRVRPQDWEKWEIGQEVKAEDLFQEGDLVDIHGRTRSLGWQNAIKVHGWSQGPKTHGSKNWRKYGSIGNGSATPARVFPGTKMNSWQGDKKCTKKKSKILKIIDGIDEENMPETIIVVAGSVPGYSAHTAGGGSYVYLHKSLNPKDGRFKRDYVWKWYTQKGPGVDPDVPIDGHAWAVKTRYGRDVRWVAHEVKKYWPDGFPGYDHSDDPFYDDCDPKKAIKAPEW